MTPRTFPMATPERLKQVVEDYLQSTGSVLAFESLFEDSTIGNGTVFNQRMAEMHLRHMYLAIGKMSYMIFSTLTKATPNDPRIVSDVLNQIPEFRTVPGRVITPKAVGRGGSLSGSRRTGALIHTPRGGRPEIQYDSIASFINGSAVMETDPITSEATDVVDLFVKQGQLPTFEETPCPDCNFKSIISRTTEQCPGCGPDSLSRSFNRDRSCLICNGSPNSAHYTYGFKPTSVSTSIACDRCGRTGCIPKLEQCVQMAGHYICDPGLASFLVRNKARLLFGLFDGRGILALLKDCTAVVYIPLMYVMGVRNHIISPEAMGVENRKLLTSNLILR